MKRQVITACFNFTGGTDMGEKQMMSRSNTAILILISGFRTTSDKMVVFAPFENFVIATSPE